MAIKIITMVGDNYGSALQAYALQHTIKTIGGGQTSTIYLRPKSYLLRFVRTYLIPTQYDSFGKKIRKAQADFINRKKRAKVRNFWKRNIILERVRRLEDTISKDGMSVTYVCGSDQIWNPQFQPNTLFYLDSQAVQNCMKFSYAASVAVEELDDKQAVYFSEKLNSFGYISVREMTGKKLLEGILNKPVRVDVDPVLLENVDFWKKIKSDRFQNENYILLYMLRPMPELVEFAKCIAVKKNLKVLYIGDFCFEDSDIISCHDAGVEDFLSAIYFAEYVITNSFHATVFSTLFCKRFCSYAVSRTGTRVHDYLVDVGLEKCQISDLKQRDYSFVEKIDWNRVYSRIDIRRKESLDYIKCIVEQDSVNNK